MIVTFLYVGLSVCRPTFRSVSAAVLHHSLGALSPALQVCQLGVLWLLGRQR